MWSSRYELYLHQTLFLSYQTTWNRFSEVQMPYPACQNNFPTWVVDVIQKYFSACGRLASGYSAPNAHAHHTYCSQPPRYYSEYHRTFISDIFCAISTAGGGCMDLCAAQCKHTTKSFLLHFPSPKNCYKNVFSIPGTGIPFCPHLCTRIKIALRSTIFLVTLVLASGEGEFPSWVSAICASHLIAPPHQPLHFQHMLKRILFVGDDPNYHWANSGSFGIFFPCSEPPRYFFGHIGA
jgi:hypothetical protein